MFFVINLKYRLNKYNIWIKIKWIDKFKKKIKRFKPYI